MIEFDLEELTQELQMLPKTHRIAFAASCCERLLPNYQAFTLIEQWGNWRVLRESLDNVWEWLKGEVLSNEQLLSLSEQCEAIAPDTEDFSSLFTSSALDAANAVALTLQSCIKGDAAKCGEVASLARETIDMYIQMRDNLDYSDLDFEIKILNDSLMQEEMRKQAEDINSLKKAATLTEDFLINLKKSSETLGIQPILRGIIKA
ncbi:MAG: DUF416 family protein [Acidobacteriota bacterium]|nr:DUF416 family protein [Acidobacteriota bacterium]